MSKTKGAAASGTPAPEEYDLVIIGSGTGAKLAANERTAVLQSA